METTINQNGRNGLFPVDHRLYSCTGFISNLKSFLILFVTITLISCGGGGSDPAPVISDKVEATFSPAGGTLVWTASNNQSTATLTVPDGALDNDTTITIQSTSASVPGLDFIPGTVLEFGPDGLVFNKPVDLVINYNPAALGSISATTLKIYRISNNLAVALPSTVDATANTITTSITGFSTFGVAVAPGDVVVPDDVVFSAWVGVTNTEVTFPAEANGLDFIRSTEFDCDIANYSLCANGQLDVLSGMTVTDSAANTSRAAWYSLQDGAQISLPTAVTATRYSTRTNGTQVIAFNNKLWLIGGSGAGLKNDVWSSSDGVAWIEETAAAEFPARFQHQVEVFNGKLWIIGGLTDTGTGYANDVWSSSDGVSWTEVTTSGPIFSPRHQHQLVDFGNKLWLIGGVDDNNVLKNDIWSSSDGVNWSEVTTSGTIFTPRGRHQAVAFNGKLCVIGGYFDPGTVFTNYNDVWCSSDGVTWNEDTASAGFSARNNHQVEVFNNKLWVIGGQSDTGSVSDVWSSSDGVAWVEETAAAEFPAFFLYQAVVFNNKLWNIGDDAWSSIDGANWINETTAAEFSVRAAHQVVVFNSELWLIGGNSYSGYKNDVWRSSDGLSWSEVATSGTIFSPRLSHQVTVFNGKLWVIGGLTDASLENDVWSSSDGITWTEETAAAGFTTRYYHQVVAFNSKLWLIGGLGPVDGVDYKNDVWSSSDGITWTEETAAAAFSARSRHQVVVFNNKLWLIGGRDGLLKNDVWSSSDGVSWIRETDAAGFSPRSYTQAEVINNKLWIIGGFDGGYKNDVWSSSDGVTWAEVTSSGPVFSPRFNHQVVVFNNKLMIIGGSDNIGNNNDVWSSSDGASWSLSYRNVIRFQ